ncbi:MAG: hypothetical protein ACRD63_07050, partial [Pyrinomonadaceae bacterium]
VSGETRIIKDRHLKLSLRMPLSANKAGRVNFIDAIWWDGKQRANFMPLAGSHIDIVYRVELNFWRGQERLQLVIEDMRAASAASG